MRSQGKPIRSIAPGAKFSTRMSERLISSVKISLPRSDLVLSVTLRLLQFNIVKYRLSTSGRSRSCLRVMSPVGDSSFTTSAPSQASTCVQDGPDCTWVMSRTRTPSRALAMTPPLLVHGLVHRARGVDLWVHPDVDQRRLAGLAGPLQCRADARRVAHLRAIPAKHFRELVVPDVAERVADPAAGLAVLLDLAVPDLIHRRVVADDPHEREVEPDQRLEVPAGEAERAVPEQAH